MRQPKSDTIAQYRDQFLEGRSEEFKNKFDSKTLDQQYAAINNWKKNAKNLGVATKDLAKATAATVVTYLKDAHKKLVKLESLTPREAQKIQNLLDSVKDAIDNFDKIKKQQLIQTLQSEKDRLRKQNEYIDLQIQKLQEQLEK